MTSTDGGGIVMAAPDAPVIIADSEVAWPPPPDSDSGGWCDPW